jgi:hypothetical protein
MTRRTSDMRTSVNLDQQKLQEVKLSGLCTGFDSERQIRLAFVFIKTFTIKSVPGITYTKNNRSSV